MTSDTKAFHQPAMKSDAASIAIDTVLALKNLEIALLKVSAKTSVDVSEEVKAIGEASDSLRKQFAELTGWQQNVG